ncbi:hypothetical protein DVK85_00345 [Flavobacterium arcticum]|uniref:Uncharacterized protein n=1 Tax=Flavobacterium arcticum TaxID=1784713 RepID=A0A345H853_9FLAO|nr:hypothetical protein [Flavobacterium arcticum]AXG72763.1 hypothetical protein DVK85_00345 [Flavobacterium arcticum]KAF2510967.1 hypothetical protein E0W72_06125 [Flavobacterium arcticum]
MKKGLLFMVITLFSMCLFVFGIPIDILSKNSTLLTLISTIICTILFAYTILYFFQKKIEEKPDNNDSNDDSGLAFFGLIILFLFGFGAFQIANSINVKEKELQKNGKLVIATVTDVISFEEYIKLEFLLENGSKYTAKVDVSADELPKYYKNKKVPIVYSKKYFSIVKILKNDKELSEYSNNASRDLNLNDLVKLFEFDSDVKVTEYLNTINLNWTNETYDGLNGTYYNLVRDISIEIDSNQITYIHSKYEVELFDDELKQLGFTSNSSEGVKFYNNDTYIIMKKLERIKNKRSEDFVEDDILSERRSITIVSIIKK